MTVLVWEESFMDDTLTLRLGEGGEKLGDVEQDGGYWIATYSNETIACRADKDSAMIALSNYAIHRLRERALNENHDR